MLDAHFRQNLVPQHILKVFTSNFILAIRLVYLNTSVSSKATEVTTNLLALKKIAITANSLSPLLSYAVLMALETTSVGSAVFPVLSPI